MAVSNATNFSNPKDMFEGRSAYKEEFPKTNIQFDTGYSNRLFGKVDTLGNAIQINESYLSFFATSYDKDNVSCIKFMAEAFLDCRKQYNILVSKGNINTSSPFFKETLPVYKGWKKQESLFSSNSNNFYRTLLKYITDNSFKIGDFETYTEIALKFLEENTIPLTRVGFFESTLNPMHTTGLVLEIYEGDAGSDEFREQFISDPNYSLVSDLFADRGLRFDTQVPWRLIANLQSNNLKKYLLKDFDTLDFNIQDIFDKFYFKSFEGVEYNAFQEFKNTLRSFYTAYKNIFPKYDQFVYRESPVQQTFSKGAYISNDCSGIKNIFVYAQDIKLVPDSKEEDLYFLDLYYKARVIETKSNYSDSLKQFHRDNYRGLYLYNSKRQTGIIKAIQYINYNIGTLAFRSPSVDEINLTRAGNDATM
jgi:hypothetical protein